MRNLGNEWAGRIGGLSLLAVVCVGVTSRAEPARMPAASPVLTRQVLLTRAGFSVGAIDGRDGPKTRAALAAFRSAHPDRRLEASAGEAALRTYDVTPEDAAGPFNPELPADMMAQGRLDALPYTSLVEMLAERFRATPELLARLNGDRSMAAGTAVVVPNVEPMAVPEQSRHRETPDPAAAPDAVVHVSKSRNELVVRDGEGGVLYYAPVSSGSEHDPLPLGTWTVTGVYLRPLFNYNPDLFWDADPAHAATRLPGGPNGPVGLVWIDLDKEHYGLHGTPAPDRIGIAQSHGCVRLTNWDALEVARLVAKGTRVLFEP